MAASTDTRRLCGRCKVVAPEPKRSRCEPCQVIDRTRERARRRRRARAGLCRFCDRKPQRGRRYCSQHLKYHRAAAKAYRLKREMVPRPAGVPWRSHNYDRVVDYLVEYPGAPGSAIAADLDLPRPSMYVQLARMKALGLVARMGLGWKVAGHDP